jgi:hypothetical protein
VREDIGMNSGCRVTATSVIQFKCQNSNVSATVPVVTSQCLQFCTSVRTHEHVSLPVQLCKIIELNLILFRYFVK